MSLLLASQKNQRTFSIFIYFVFKPYPLFSSFAGLLDLSLSLYLSLSLSLEMTPVFLNPPPSSPFSDLVLEQREEQLLKLVINSQYNEPSSSLSSPIAFFNSTQDQRSGSDVIIGSQQSDQKAVNIDQDFTSSQSLPTCQIRDQDNITTEEDQYNMMSSDKSMNNNSNNNGSAVKYWMSSKMRLMQKMSPAATTDHRHQYKREKPAHKVRDSPPQQDKAGEPMFSFSQSHSSTSGTVIRVCSDCNTTTTPLWRSGPRGPKSLCNACGIRQRKARRAMAEAAKGLVVGADSANHTPIKTASYYKTQYHINKEKKSRANHSIGHYKNNKLKLVHTTTSTCPKSQRNNNKNYNNYDDDDDNINNKLCLRKLSFGLNDNYCSAFSGVFPKDVAEAAVLLMELSCGFVQS